MTLTYFTPPPPSLQKPAGQLGLPLVLDELVPAVIHCLYEEKWSGRMAGIQCLDMLLDTLPNKLLWSWSPQIVHGALLVGAALPAHSNKERRMVEAFTQRVFSVLYPPTEGPGEGVGTVGVGGDVEMKEVGGGGDATPVSAVCVVVVVVGGGHNGVVCKCMHAIHVYNVLCTLNVHTHTIYIYTHNIHIHTQYTYTHTVYIMRT